ncbi:DUF2795 domain-containing protein [Methanobacterium sp. ACI-7]|uniref:DUF2795 domain-containing protein n=1 Tax=unclassified Methanobacterium TaxID=2627676 RepID=UPI0039C0425B
MARQGRVTAATVEKSIKGINFPASKQDLIQQAKSNNADQQVIQEIENLPQDQFSSPIDISKAFGQSH